MKFLHAVFQLHEERCRLRLLEAERGAGRPGGMDVDEANIFLGASPSGRGTAAICPELLSHVSEKLKSEAAIMKERRKAHEERELLKKAQKGTKGAGEPAAEKT